MKKTKKPTKAESDRIRNEAAEYVRAFEEGKMGLAKALLFHLRAPAGAASYDGVVEAILNVTEAERNSAMCTGFVMALTDFEVPAFLIDRFRLFDKIQDMTLALKLFLETYKYATKECEEYLHGRPAANDNGKKENPAKIELTDVEKAMAFSASYSAAALVVKRTGCSNYAAKEAISEYLQHARTTDF